MTALARVQSERDQRKAGLSITSASVPPSISWAHYSQSFPEDESLNKVEKDTIIPALMMEHVRREECADLWSTLAECSKRYHWASVVLCRRNFDAAMMCNRK
ncbi:Mitochondrial aspartate/glutamate carrier protein [Sparganum proliferum]